MGSGLTIGARVRFKNGGPKGCIVSRGGSIRAGDGFYFMRTDGAVEMIVHESEIECVEWRVRYRCGRG